MSGTPSRFLHTSSTFSASSRLTASRSAGSLLQLSPAQQTDLDELECRMAQREEMLECFTSRRTSARARAIGRGESFWVRRNREEAKRARVQRACDEAARAMPIRYLPKLPEVRSLALRSWAMPATVAAEEETRAERKLVEELNDDMTILSTIINRWQRPSMSSQWIDKLKSSTQDHRGHAPQARHFRSLNNSLPWALAASAHPAGAVDEVSAAIDDEVS